MKIEEKIEEMNEAADGTLTIVHFVDWELSSYRDHNLFSALKGANVRAKSFKELIEKAYERFETSGGIE